MITQDNHIQFQAILNSSPDGILLVDGLGKIISYNQQFVDLWNIPDDVVEAKSDERAIQSVSGCLVHSDIFLNKVKHLYSQPEEVSRDELSLTDGRIFDSHTAPLFGAENNVLGRIWYFRDITEQKRNIQEIVHLSSFPELNPNPVLEINPEGRILYSNRAAREVIAHLGLGDKKVFIPEDIRELYVQAKKESLLNIRRDREIAERFYKIEISFLFNQQLIRIYASDETESKNLQRQQVLTADVLRIINNPDSIYKSIAEILGTIKRVMGFEALGIRLQNGEDYPYFVTEGFPDYFIENERYLCTRNEMGEIVRNKQGKPVLECMCGNILCGRTNAVFPSFTAGGSFWSNCTTDLLASTTEKDRQTQGRNYCNREGYESVAIIPLRIGDEIIGLLQFNDHRKNRFTLQMIKYFEELGESIGIALMRKQSEVQLLESKALFEAVVENVPLMIFLKEAKDLRFIIFNRAGEDLLGYERKLLLGKNNLDLFPPEQAAYFMAKDREVLDGLGDVLDIPEEPIDTAKKGQRLLHTRKVCIRGSDGKTKYLLGISEDITARKQGELALLENEKKYRELLESLNEGIWVIDVQGNTTFVNPKICELLGYTKDEMLGKHLFFFMSEEAKKIAEENIRRGQQGIKEHHNFEFVRKDGMPIQTSIETSPLLDEKGNYTGAIAGIIDITDRTRLEKEKKNLQAQVFNSSKLASVGTLAAGVAHEVNNPLMIIKGNISILRDQITNMGESEAVARILDKQDMAVERIASIVNGLRTFARADTAIVEAIDINKTIEDTLGFCEGIYNKSNLTFKMQLNAKNPFIQGNIGKLQQVIMNLLSNAKDACESVTRAGVFIIETSDEDDAVVLKVSDNGAGIKKEHMGKIFDPFFTTKPSGLGTGLGLSVSYSIIQLFGGIIHVDSEPGIGTTFIIKFPKPALTTQTEKTPCQHVKRRFSGSVLIVDDEEDICEILVSYVTELGFVAISTTNGEDAFAILKNKTFDYVITDLKMPKMNGDILLEKTHLFPHLAQTRFIVITGGVITDYTQHQRDHIRELAHGYLRKPFDMESVALAFEKSLNLRRD